MMKARAISVVMGALTALGWASGAWTWSDDPNVNVPVCVAPADQVIPRIAADGAGGAFVAWSDARGGLNTHDIYAQHLRADGGVDPAWPVNGLAVCTSPGHQEAVRVLADGQGGAFVSWEVHLEFGNVHVQHVLATGALDPAWPAGGLRVSPLAGTGQWDSRMAPDGAGGILIVWSDARAGQSDMFLQHVRADGTLDPSWPQAGLVVTDASEHQWAPEIVPDGAGGAIVAWYDNRNGGYGNTDVYAMRVLGDGRRDPSWPAAGLPVCTASGDQWLQGWIPDGAGGAIACWSDFRGGSAASKIYAHRVLSNGSLDGAWPRSGRAVCSAPGRQQAARMASDGAGGAYVAWQDFRNDPDRPDVYAQHVLASGRLDSDWTPQGRAVRVGADGEADVAALADGEGGVLLMWRNTATNQLGAQRLTTRGEPHPRWPLNGRVVCAGAGWRGQPIVTTDDRGGLIAAWEDWRSDRADVYAQRVSGDGALGDVVGNLERYEAILQWGTQGSGPGQFDFCPGVATDAAGNVYVVDHHNHRVQKFTGTGAYLTGWGGQGAGPGQLFRPFGAAIGPDGTVYVTDNYNHRIQKFGPDGDYRGQWGARGSGNGEFELPAGIAVDARGDVYVAEYLNHRVQKFDRDGAYLLQWGAFGSGDGEFSSPVAVAVDPSGRVLVADGENCRVQVFDDAGRYLSQWGARGGGPGRFRVDDGIAVDRDGFVYVTDHSNHRVQKFDAQGRFLTEWGGFGHGPGELDSPYGIAVDAEGNVFVADAVNHRIQKFARENLARNGAFDAPDVRGWSRYGDAQLRPTSPGRGGSGYALEITAPDAVKQYGINDHPNWVAEVPAAGTVYRFTAWVRGAAAAGAARLRVREYDHEVRVGGSNYSNVVAPNQAFQRITLDYAARRAGAELDLQVLSDPHGAGSWIVVDDVSIQILGVVDPATLRAAAGLDLEVDDLPPVAASGSIVIQPQPLAARAVARFATARPGPLRAELLDASGRRVLTLVDVPFAPAGPHELLIDRARPGAWMPAGVYFLRIRDAGGTRARRMIVLP